MHNGDGCGKRQKLLWWVPQKRTQKCTHHNGATNFTCQFNIKMFERIPNEPGRDLNWREHHLMTAIKNRQENFLSKKICLQYTMKWPSLIPKVRNILRALIWWRDVIWRKKMFYFSFSQSILCFYPLIKLVFNTIDSTVNNYNIWLRSSLAIICKYI